MQGRVKNKSESLAGLIVLPGVRLLNFLLCV